MCAYLRADDIRPYEIVQKKKRQHNFCTVLVGADDGDCLMQKVLPRQLLAVRNPNPHQRSP